MPHTSLTVASLKLGRALALAGLIGLAVAGCGRRGPLEAPPDTASAIALPDEDIGAVQDSFAEQQASPLGPPRKRNLSFKIPESRFALDPIL